MRILVDSNVFLDYLLRREDKWRDALEFLSWCRDNKNQIYVTSISLRDIEYIAHKECHNKEITRKAISALYSTIGCKIIGVSADSAINAMFSDYKDFEDELQIEAAKEAMLDAIVTNNIKDFEDSAIPVFSPKQIVSYN